MRGVSAHTKYDFSYHVVFVPKMRRKIFGGRRTEYCRTSFIKVAQEIECKFDTLKIAVDHVHMLVMIPPKVSVSKALQHMKGKVAHRAEFTSKHVNDEVRKFKKARKAGLKTLGVCEPIFANDEWMLLTTSAFDENWIALGDKGDTAQLQTFGVDLLKEISSVPNFDNFLNEIFQQARIAYEANLKVGSDAYFIKFKPDNNEMDFVIGDVGSIYKPQTGVKATSIWKDNLESVTKRLNDFIQKNVKKDYR